LPLALSRHRDRPFLVSASKAQASRAHTKNAQVATFWVAPGGPLLAIVHAGDLNPSAWSYFSICIMDGSSPSNREQRTAAIAHSNEHRPCATHTTGTVDTRVTLSCVAAEAGALRREAPRVEEGGAVGHVRTVGECGEEGADRDDEALSER